MHMAINRGEGSPLYAILAGLGSGRESIYTLQAWNIPLNGQLSPNIESRTAHMELLALPKAKPAHDTPFSIHPREMIRSIRILGIRSERGGYINCD